MWQFIKKQTTNQYIRFIFIRINALTYLYLFLMRGMLITIQQHENTCRFLATNLSAIG